MTVCASIFFTPGIFERLTPIEIWCIGQLNKVANDMYHNITVDQWLYLYLQWCKRRVPVTIHDDEYWMGIY
ncbi:MAG: hypothetical protein KC414_09460, partial [Romboutsia sp.]|nr:hypothetical protein [Romboutsia sp.]